MKWLGDLAIFGAFLTIILLAGESECLYEDQVGKFDWLIQLIGKPKFVHYVHNGQSVKRIVVGTEQNVLAVLNAKNGALGWRHVFEKSSNGHIDDLKVLGQNVIIIQRGGIKVRCFNLVTGSLKWESSIPSSIDHQASLQSFRHNSALLAVSTNTNLTALNVDTGSIKWSALLPNSGNTAYTKLARADGHVVVVKVKSSSHVNLIGYDQNKVILFNREIQAPWISADSSDCSISTGKHVVCLDRKNNKLHSLSLQSDQPFNTFLFDQEMLSGNFIPSFQSLEEIGNSGVDIVALKVRTDNILVFSCQNGNVQLLHNLKGVSAIQTVIFSGEILIGALSRVTSETLEFSTLSLSSKALPDQLRHSFRFPAHHGKPVEFYGTLLKMDSSGSLSSSFLVISEDSSIVSVQKSGKFMWTREESLSDILSSEMVDLPVSKIMAKMEDEFGVEESILQMFVKRFTTQFSQLKTFLLQLKQSIGHFHHHHHHHRHHQNQATEEDEDADDDSVDDVDDDVLDENYLTRDEFNLHKMIIVVTAAGKIFGIDSNSGKNIWKLFISDLEPFRVMSQKMIIPLYVQRTTSHFPHQPLCTLIGRSKSTGKTLLFSFHPISGTSEISSRGDLLNFKVINMMMLHQLDEHFLHPIVLLDDKLRIHVVPETAKDVVEKISQTLFMFNVDADLGTASGFSISHIKDELVADPRWSLDLGKNSHVVTGVYSTPANEQVHLRGLALEDRSVLYKYLNPNLVVVITEGEDSTQKDVHLKGMFNVYLIDSVSGKIIYHCTHRRSKGPVNVVHSENWVVYNYWNQKYRRNELAILEMFEGTTQANATAFSSLYGPPQPIVLKQAYIFPGHLASLGVTLTEKGLTSKELLFALESGSILGLPKMLIDSRRPEAMSHESREEGLIPYVPELMRPSDRILNYYKSVHNVRQIKTSPAGLESTSLVLCYGLDIFYTRVTPSKMFDVLKEDYDYFFISCVLVGMIATSLLSQKLAARKILNRAWK